MRSWQSRNREKCLETTRRCRIKRQYGLTHDQLEQMRANQQNRCVICGDEFSDTNRACVDHDHETGAIRDLLCSKCNQGIGCLKESTAVLHSAIEYLTKHANRCLGTRMG